MTDLATRLTTLGYLRLFLSLDNGELDTLWREPGIETALEVLVRDTRIGWEARFLAAEILWDKLPVYPPKSETALLAPLYVQALRHAEMANIWGMPGQLDGAAGRHLTALGLSAADRLALLLDDARPVRYVGSKEATFGNSYSYRVKDFAAFFIHNILGLPYILRDTPPERDVEIIRLRDRLRRG